MSIFQQKLNCTETPNIEKIMG